jgi:UV DNA damage endonuclease
MHPGQYTVLNSPDKAVVKRAVEDLRYHTGVLDALKLGLNIK